MDDRARGHVHAQALGQNGFLEAGQTQAKKTPAEPVRPQQESIRPVEGKRGEISHRGIRRKEQEDRRKMRNRRDQEEEKEEMA